MNGIRVGQINLRIGYVRSLYYGGQIGYDVDEAYRGNGYAGKACGLLAPVMGLHGMELALYHFHFHLAEILRIFPSPAAPSTRGVALLHLASVALPGTKTSRNLSGNLKRKLVLITNSVENVASRRVCEKIGAKFLHTVSLPADQELYREGQRAVNIFEWHP